MLHGRILKNCAAQFSNLGLGLSLGLGLGLGLGLELETGLALHSL